MGLLEPPKPHCKSKRDFLRLQNLIANPNGTFGASKTAMQNLMGLLEAKKLQCKTNRTFWRLKKPQYKKIIIVPEPLI